MQPPARRQVPRAARQEAVEARAAPAARVLIRAPRRSLGSAVGLLALLGLAVRVSVLSIRRLQDLERAEDALRRAAQGASGRS
jgi:multidrug efflux pump subunit AcrB